MTTCGRNTPGSTPTGATRKASATAKPAARKKPPLDSRPGRKRPAQEKTSPNRNHRDLRYPFGLASEQIPVQAKMITTCDICDVLSASDRPYKRSLPTDRALDILKLCVRDEQVDAELFRVFLHAQIYRLAQNPS
jgi:hypothetical protein